MGCQTKVFFSGISCSTWHPNPVNLNCQATDKIMNVKLILSHKYLTYNKRESQQSSLWLWMKHLLILRSTKSTWACRNANISWHKQVVTLCLPIKFSGTILFCKMAKRKAQQKLYKFLKENKVQFIINYFSMGCIDAVEGKATWHKTRGIENRRLTLWHEETVKSLMDRSKTALFYPVCNCDPPLSLVTPSTRFN